LEFRLIYRGRLKAQNPGKDHVSEVRRFFHPQLKELWSQDPLKSHRNSLSLTPPSGITSTLQKIGKFTFAPLVSTRFMLLAKLDILFLRPAPPGTLFKDGGDIDNRVKTLIDALKMPTAQEIPSDFEPTPSEDPFFCLLEDDKLVTEFSVVTDRLLTAKEENSQSQDCNIIIHVTLKASRGTWDNIDLA